MDHNNVHRFIKYCYTPFSCIQETTIASRRKLMHLKGIFMKHNAQQGFTLVELMVTVAIVGILSAVAIPNYQNYISNSKLLAAHTTLTTSRNAAEQYFQDNRSYAGLCVSNTPTPTANFNFSCTANQNSYLFTATAKSSSGITGWAFTIDQNNTHTTSATPSGVSAPSGCWASKVTGVC